NFEGRISPHVKANYLASPPLVVAYAIAGSMKIDLYTDPIGQDSDGNDVFLKDIWPSNQEIRQTVEECLTSQMFKERYADVFKGTKEWQEIAGDESGQTYDWQMSSTYVKHPTFFEGMTMDVANTEDVKGARALALLGDSVTTDHISPAGAIATKSPAGEYLKSHQIQVKDFNSYGSRRGNHEVMMRGTFANVRIRNLMLDNVEGGYTKHVPSDEQMSIYDDAMKYQEEGTPLVVIAGKEYGTGSSRDWAAKGTRLLGVKAVIAESFERIHRSNLVGMGVLPLVFKDGVTRESLNLDGSETFDLSDIAGDIKPGQDVTLTIHRADGKSEDVALKSRIDTLDEVDYYKHGGILHYVLRDLAA
ncbi:MAG: aconitate hydratase, partial [Pseudomonadota bacterium]